MRYIGLLICGMGVAAASASFLVHSPAAASPSVLNHLPRLPAVQPAVGALFAALNSPSARLPPKPAADALLQVLRRYPESDAAWTRDTDQRVRACTAAANVPSSKVVSAGCYAGGCAFIIETDTEQQQQQLARVGSQRPECSGRHGHVKTVPWHEAGKVRVLTVHLAPFQHVVPARIRKGMED
jgi:hypothetical protein